MRIFYIIEVLTLLTSCINVLLSKQGHTVHNTAIDEKGVADRQRNRF